MSKGASTKAVIYCRVSSDRQLREGDGLRSQETRCREYAKQRGFIVIKVFKEEGVSGGLTTDDRPAAKDLFAFLDLQREQVTVIIDHLDRVARSQKAYIDFSTRLHVRGAALASPSHTFGSRPEDLFLTDIMVSVASYQRESNKERVKNRQCARMMNGYYVFPAPPGYKYTNDLVAGRVMARDEPRDVLVAEALESFASGRFESQADVQRFLSSSGAFGKSGITGSRVKTLLKNILYTGYLERLEWGVTLREGRHPALISMQTYQRVQERLGLGAKTPYRKDLNTDFPLRGFVLCAACEQPMTAAWTTSGSKSKHPYYRCKNPACLLDGKSIRRQDIETAFEDALRQMKPSQPVLRLVEAVVRDCWKKKRGEHGRRVSGLEREQEQAAQAVGNLAALIARTTDSTLIKIYENQLKEQEHRRSLLAAEVAQCGQVDTSYESALGTALDFLGNPLAMWQNGDLDDKRMVLKLAFARKVPFDRDTGLGTAVKSLPFTVFQGSQGSGSKMVEEVGFEPTYS